VARLTVRLPPGVPDLTTTVAPIRRITVRAFYRRMTTGERAQVRASNQSDTADFRDDLTRSRDVELDDAHFLELLTGAGFDEVRQAELRVDGTKEETEL